MIRGAPWSVTATGPEPVRKVKSRMDMVKSLHRIHTLLAGLCLAMLATNGCAPYQAYDGPRLPRDQVAVLMVRPAPTGLALSTPRIVGLNGRNLKDAASHADYGAIELLPGSHRVDLEVLWSNGWREAVCFDAAVRGGRTYNAQVYEAPQTSDLGSVNCRPPGKVAELGLAVVGGAAAGVLTAVAAFTWPIWLPIVLLTGSDAEHPSPPTSRPDHQCFVWVWDTSSWEVVAGGAPGG
jgi:hypothetical protein